MIRRWLTVEQAVFTLAQLINQGTDQDLVTHLQGWSPEQVRWTVSHISREGDTVLHLAAVRERAAGVRVMLDSQADVNGRDGHGRSPLHACLCHNSLASARLLISFGADVNEIVCRQTRESLLHRMIKANRPLAVELLMEMGTSLKAVTKDGDTPLHFAARYDRLKMARFLSLMGADVNAVNQSQEMPLHVAIANQSLDVAKVLVKNKASVTVKDSRGMTPLHLAVISGNVELVRLILNINSTQVNSKETVLGRTPLLLACSASSPKLVALLLSHGADVTLTTHYRKSVLHVAATSGSPKVLSTIIKSTPNPNLLATNNQTPLHCAAVRGQGHIVKILLDAGAKVNMKDLDGNTALHIAAQAGNNEVINLLIQHGIQMNLTNMLQQTALHLASMADHTKTCSLLVSAGSDPDILDLNQAKAAVYLDKFGRKGNRKVGAEAGIKREVTVRFCSPGYAHLQVIQENKIGDVQMESVDFDRSKPSQLRDNRSGNDQEMYVLDNSTAHMNLKNSLESNKAETGITLNGNKVNNECSTNIRLNYKQDTAEGTKSDSGEDSSCDEKTGSQNQKATRTRHRKSRARMSKITNNKTGRIATREMSDFSNGNVIKQEDIDQRKRKQGVTK